MYNSDAFWLTQWNLNILWGLAWPEVEDDISSSLIQYADTDTSFHVDQAVQLILCLLPIKIKKLNMARERLLQNTVKRKRVKIAEKVREKEY